MKRFFRISTLAELKKTSVSGWDGILFGAEFCASRLPSHSDILEARARCENEGILFRAVSPVARERDFGLVAAWLAKAVGPGGTWTANDYGILRWAARELKGTFPHAGRLLSRQQRDPRVGTMLEGMDEEEKTALSGSLWDEPANLGDLEDLNVCGVELDAVEWGMVRPPLPKNFELSVHAPYALVSWSPACFFGPGLLGPCAAPCSRAVPVRMENEEDPHPLWTRGNAIFSRTGEEESLREAGRVGADNLVWSPYIPG